MVLIEPKDLDQPTLSTEHIIKVIDDNASSAALILLSAIQFYTGQYFDIERITAHAHSQGILIGWDCAHAAGNVDLRLHDWNVDFAAWCNYKYLNSGPGGIAGLFVHERHGSVNEKQPDGETFRPRLSGWWGGDIKTRFNMENSMYHGFDVQTNKADTGRILAPTWRGWVPALEPFRPRHQCGSCISRDIQSCNNERDSTKIR